MDQHDREQFCNFFRRSRYDIIQARQGDGWGPVWTYAPCDPRVAAKAAQMLLKMHRGDPPQVRHARRARLRDRQRRVDTNVVVVTTLPERTQAVMRIDDGVTIRVNAYLQDEALAALEAALTPTPRP